MKDALLDDPLLPTAFIIGDRLIGDRALRKQVKAGRFPPPSCNIAGMNYWRASVYREWKAAALMLGFTAVPTVVHAVVPTAVLIPATPAVGCRRTERGE